jgi:hypothetical protein
MQDTKTPSQTTDPGLPAVIMGVAVTILTMSNGQQIVCSPYEEFVADLKSVLANSKGYDEL